MHKKKALFESFEREGFPKYIVDAFQSIKREKFIPGYLREYAYWDNALPIGDGATISQPYTIAFMLNLLELDKLKDRKNKKVLEIGSGTGYVLALIDEILEESKITGIELIEKHVRISKAILKNRENISIICGNGLKEINDNKFDRILVSASAKKKPEKLIKSLNENGILVIPIRDSIFQFKKKNGKVNEKEFYGFSFVPLIEE